MAKEVALRLAGVGTFSIFRSIRLPLVAAMADMDAMFDKVVLVEVCELAAAMLYLQAPTLYQPAP